MADTLTITDNRTGKQYEISIQDGTIRAADLRQIKVTADEFGMMTYDPAFMNTAACRSRITFIDGDKGILLYRGYPIDQLAEHSDFLETSYLLLFGELPTRRGARGLDARDQRAHRCCTENLRKFVEGFRYDAHPMGMFLSVMGTLSTFYPDAKNISDPQLRRLQMVRMIAKVPGIAAYGLPPHHRPAVRPAGHRSELYRQLPQHAVQDDGGPLQAAPRPRARARRAVHPARRPRAELQHGDDAQYRQLARRSVFGAGRRRRGALRPAARRRQRGGAADARQDRSARRTSRRSSSASRAARAG